MGEILEQQDRHHVAIKWYRKAVELCEASPQLQNRDPIRAYALSCDYGNLGLALKRSGYLVVQKRLSRPAFDSVLHWFELFLGVFWGNWHDFERS